VTSVAPPSPGAFVLKVDPDLGADIDPAEREVALRVCRGELVRIPRGPWPAAAEVGEDDDLVAFVIVDGLVAREIGLREQYMLELLGHCDVLQPPVASALPRMTTPTRLTAVSDLVLLVLGQAFLRAAARWPSLLTKLHRRLELQRESLAIQGVIAHVPNAEHRVLLMLWHLAERWGYVTPEGTVLPLALNHQLLGQLVGARRPTVTLAVGALAAAGVVHRRDDGSWLLTASAERRINAIARPSRIARSAGERLMLYQVSNKTASEARALRAAASRIVSARVARDGHGHDGGAER
jgi:CRP-like cAMP-binding protein